MKFKQFVNTLLKFVFILGLSTFLISCTNDKNTSDQMSGGNLVGVNYTGEGIQRFSVDNSGGGTIGKYSISGDYCCTMYPKIWTADLRVEVEWVRNDCERQRHLCTLETAMQGKTPSKEIRKTIPIEQYTERGAVYLVFLPHDEVRLYISNGGPFNTDFADNRGFPQDPSEKQRTKP